MKKRILSYLLTLCMVLCLMPFGANAAGKLSAPDVTAKNVASSGKIKLSWDEVEGAETYRIYRSTSKNGSYEKIKTTAKTGYTDNSAEAGKQYYYKVKAVGNGATSGSSAVVTRVCDLPRPDVTVKNTASTGKVKLSWKEIDSAEKYVVYRATSKSGEYKKLKTTTATAYTDSSAKVGKTYYYQVVAVHAKSSANSAKSAADKGIRDLPRPDVTVKLNSNDQPKLSWEAIEGAEKYVVYRSTSKSGEYTKLKTTTKTSYTDKTAEACVTYYYKVKAVHSKSSANSAYSSVDKIKVPKTGHTHTYTSSVTTEASCSAEGVKTYTCACSDSYTEAIPMTEHTTTTETSEATCMTSGYTREVCTQCSTVISETTIPATDCSYTITKRMSAVAKSLYDQGEYDYTEYGQYEDWDVDVCEGCGYPDMATLRFAYTSEEATEIMLGYVNELRESVYGTSEYNLIIDEDMVAKAEIRAEEIGICFSHGGTFTGAVAENITNGGVNIYDHFISWKESPGHYNAMINPDYLLFGYGTYQSSTGYYILGVQLFL